MDTLEPKTQFTVEFLDKKSNEYKMHDRGNFEVSYGTADDYHQRNITWYKGLPGYDESVVAEWTKQGSISKYKYDNANHICI